MPPSISSFSGTWNHGNSVTISGSAFGSKGGSDANKPLIWADFESSGDPTSLGLVTTWTGTSQVTRTTGGIQYGVSSWNQVGTSPGSGSWSPTLWITRTFSDHLYLSLKRYYDYAKPTNQKFFRLWRNEAPENSWDIVASTSNGGIIANEGCGGDGDRFQPVSWLEDTWKLDEFRVALGTINDCGGDPGGNGLFQFTQNGTQQQLESTLTNNVGVSTYGRIMCADNFTDIFDPIPANGAKVYMDDIYVDDTWARVIVGNASTLAASTQREMQIPSAWGGTSITITVNRGAFGASATAWLYVFDSDNVASAGFQFDFGSSSGGGDPFTQRHWLTQARPSARRLIHVDANMLALTTPPAPPPVVRVYGLLPTKMA